MRVTCQRASDLQTPSRTLPLRGGMTRLDARLLGRVAAAVVQGATAVVTTVHPMGADRETQHRIGVEGTAVLAPY